MINLRTSAKSKLFFAYLFLFFITAIGCFLPFLISGKTFVSSDAYSSENLSTFSYFVSQLKDFSFLQFDFSLGQGGDSTRILQSFGGCDPLNLIGLIFPKSSIFFLYNFLFIVRLFLSGLTFLIYCKYRKFDEYTTVLGSLIYAFSGFALVFGVQNQAFLSPMIYLPLICLGVERILACKRPLLFIIFTVLYGISDFQFVLPLAIFSFLYFLIRFFFVIEKENQWQFYRYFVIFTFSFILGISLASFALMPNVYEHVQKIRLDDVSNLSFFYTPSYYFNLLLSLISLNEFGNFSAIGFSAPVIIILIFVLMKKEIVMKPIKLYLFLGALFFIFPCFGFFFSSLKTVSNLWSFAFSFAGSILAARFIPNFYGAEKKIFRVPLLALIFLSLSALVYCFFNADFAKNYGVSFLVLLFSSAALGFYYLKNLETKYIFGILVLISVVANANSRFFSHRNDFLSIEESKRFSYENMEDFPDLISEDLNSGNFFRIETSNHENKNFSQTSKYKFFSTNSNLSPAELSLLSVKYFFEPRKKTIQIPHGFFNDSKRTLNYNFLENENFLPFGFTFKKVVPESFFEKLNLVQQRSQILDYAVLEDAVFGDDYEFRNDFDFSSIKKLDTKISSDNNLDYESQKISVSGSDSKLYIKVFSDSETEKWLYFKNLRKADEKSELSILIQTPERSHIISSEGDNLINLSCFSETDFTISLIFENGEYEFDELSLFGFSFGDFSEKIQTLKENHLENLVIGKNKISGNISVENQELLFLSIPFASGWKAFDNGNETDIICANGSYTSLLLEKGNHEILLQYETPGLKIGGKISLIALGVVFLILLILFIRARISQRGLIARIWHKMKMLTLRKLVK